MTEVVSTQSFRTGSFNSPEVRTVVVYDGRRGAKGLTGDKGDQGDTGDPLVMRGQWISGATYCPNDIVSAESSVMQGITNLFYYNASMPCMVSTVPPKDDPALWAEVGYTDFGDAIGNIWEVEQSAHTFTQIGLHLSFDAPSGRYVAGDPASAATAPFAVIRDIPSADRLVLQSSGLVTSPDASLIVGGGGWVDDVVYYARSNGLVADTPPPSGLAVPVFRYLDEDGVVFPFQHASAVPPPDPAPAPATTQLKLDDISGQFDNVQTVFPLTVTAAPVAWPASTESFFIYIDGNPQEPLVDFVVADNGGNAELVFTLAPPDFANFWGVYASA